jgi:hypothetical protein
MFFSERFQAHVTPSIGGHVSVPTFGPSWVGVVLIALGEQPKRWCPLCPQIQLSEVGEDERATHICFFSPRKIFSLKYSLEKIGCLLATP